MRITGRRRLDVILIGGGAVVAAAVAAFGSAAYNEERLDKMWAGATLDADGTATIHEVIDDNFGNATDRHGMDRRVPGLTTSSPVSVYSPDGAPDAINSITPFSFDRGEPGVQIRIGDPGTTVSGRHRYVIDYGLDTLTDGDEVAWDAVGTGWELAIEEVEVHLVAPFDLDDPICQIGSRGSEDECDVEEVEPGHLVARLGSLTEHRGVTLRAERGADLGAGAPALPEAGDLPPLPGEGVALPALLAFVGTLGAGASMSRWVRRAGRERVISGAGGAADVAWTQPSGTEQLVDAADLAELATTEFAPPEGISAPMGGIVLAEAVQAHHKVAWLLEAAIAGAVDIQEEDGKAKRIVRTAPGDEATRLNLDAMFGGRDTITLGAYDKTFAAGWTTVGTSLERWSDASGLWDAAADRRKLRVRIFGFVGMILGAIAVGVGGAMTGRYGGGGWLGVLVVSALVTGAGWAALLRGWELRMRTPQGSGIWLRVESFRRFLHDSEAYHAEEAAKRGVLREYTAWAVAVDEIDRWQRAISSSTTIPQSSGLTYVLLASTLTSSTSSTSTAPSSSGGGGGGGGVGGGGGGGGGGNW